MAECWCISRRDTLNHLDILMWRSKKKTCQCSNFFQSELNLWTNFLHLAVLWNAVGAALANETPDGRGRGLCRPQIETTTALMLEVYLTDKKIIIFRKKQILFPSSLSFLLRMDIWTDKYLPTLLFSILLQWWRSTRQDWNDGTTAISLTAPAEFYNPYQRGAGRPRVSR